VLRGPGADSGYVHKTHVRTVLFINKLQDGFRPNLESVCSGAVLVPRGSSIGLQDCWRIMNWKGYGRQRLLTNKFDCRQREVINPSPR
jgi:hypothetical protein